MSEKTQPIVCLDFEASCLPTPAHESYPIEVGVAFVETGEIRSWLIRPTGDWLQTGHWDPAAERVHGLSLERLQRDGQDVEVVRRELADAVAGHAVVSDNRFYEQTWAEILYDAAPPFRIESHEAVLYGRAPLPIAAFKDVLQDAEQAALVRCPKQHRAGPDAHWLAETCRLLLQWGRADHGDVAD